MQFSLVIPLWNEGKNINGLVSALKTSGLPENGMKEVFFINNGSSDDTGRMIKDFARQYSWIKDIHLDVNLNYGGGVYEGFQYCQTDIVAYIPGDLQVSTDDLLKIWEEFQKQISTQKTSRIFVKGYRTIRKDGFNTRIVSKIYTCLANALLGIKIKDVNGLPKMLHKDLLKLLPEEKMKTFVFDVQLIYTARKNRWDIFEIPVTFHARRGGVSSWSRKRLATYLTTYRQMLRLRK